MVPVGDWLVHECRLAEHVEIVTVDAIPCTATDRLAVDLAFLARRRQLSHRKFARAVEKLTRDGWTTWPDLEKAVIAASRERRSGVGLLRSIVHANLPEGVES